MVRIKQNSKTTSDLVYVKCGSYDNGTPDEVAQSIIDSDIIKADAKIFVFASFSRGSSYKMICNKASDKYASYILFGYYASRISYHTKTNGVWS